MFACVGGKMLKDVSSDIWAGNREDLLYQHRYVLGLMGECPDGCLMVFCEKEAL